MALQRPFTLRAVLSTSADLAADKLHLQLFTAASFTHYTSQEYLAECMHVMKALRYAAALFVVG